MMPEISEETLPPPMVPQGRNRNHGGGNNAFPNLWNDYSHISDPNLRRRLALSDIDKVPFGLYRKAEPVTRGAIMSEFY